MTLQDSLSLEELGPQDFYSNAADYINETIINNKYIPWQPFDQQIAFLSLPTTEAFYGGAAGGGKSVTLLMGALQYVHVPGYHAILVRRTFADLNKADSLIPLSHEWLTHTDAVWNGSKHEWIFPAGSSVTFGYCDSEKDKYNYQSSAYQYWGFDELTQFSESQYTYLMSRMRKRITLDVPLRARGAANPGGVGHDWVKSRFIIGRNKDRPFVPSQLTDNVCLDQESYNRSLDLLDAVTRAQLKHGDWNIRPEGNMFKRQWFTKILDYIPNDVVRWHRHWDLAATQATPESPNPDYASGCKIGLRTNGEYVIADMRHMRGTPNDVRAVVKQTAALDTRQCTISIEEEGGASGKMIVDYYSREVLLGYAVKGQRPNGEKAIRAQPLSAAVEQGRVAIVRGLWVPEFLDEICAFPAEGLHDDQVDAASGAFNALMGQGAGTTVNISNSKRDF